VGAACFYLPNPGRLEQGMHCPKASWQGLPAQHSSAATEHAAQHSRAARLTCGGLGAGKLFPLPVSLIKVCAVVLFRVGAILQQAVKQRSGGALKQ
jgi:hypothetical protein